QCELVKYDLEEEKFETIRSWSRQEANSIRMLYDPSCETGYGAMTETRLIRLARWSAATSDKETLRQIALSTVLDEIEAATGDRRLNGIAEMYWTGREFVLKVRDQPVVLTFASESQRADTLTILYPDRSPSTGTLITFDNPIAEKINYATLLFEAENDVAVKTILYPKRDFNQRLRMKMLAGDRDFDIVYVQDGAEMLNPLLKNNLYLPLEKDAGIVGNFRRSYTDGVEAFMTADGHLWGIPYHVVSSALVYEETGIGLDTERILREGWTEDEYWAAVDASAEPVTNIALYILLNHADDALLAGHFDRDRIVHTFTEMKKRADAGKLWNDNRETNLMDWTIPVQETDPSGQFEMNPDLGGKILLPLPGTPYAGVSSYIFGYRETEHPDAAYAYLRFLSGEYWVTLIETQKTYLAKDAGQYHRYAEGLTYLASEEDAPVFFSRNAADLAAKSAQILPLYRGSRTGLMDRDGYLAISTVIDRVWDGKVTPEEGADEFISKIGVRLFE
ncbi:MAG: extracellular solute-binding protein, partial [Clostridiales bacterium]|nr:extracellular solute-binding protein [Clostridiales bacterium]